MLVNLSKKQIEFLCELLEDWEDDGGFFCELRFILEKSYEEFNED